MDTAALSDIAACVNRGSARGLETAVGRIATFSFTETRGQAFNPKLFRLITQLMRCETFQEMQGSFHLLLLFEYDWGCLRYHQKRVLLREIEAAYPKFSDWMACFVLSELLGEFYCNKDALRVLYRLRSATRTAVRSLLPHGFEHIATGSHSGALREAAALQLRDMLTDRSVEVRKEARLALARVTRKLNRAKVPGTRRAPAQKKQLHV